MASSVGGERVIHIPAESELRLEVGDAAGGPATLRLVSGTAEVFGTELVVDKRYTIVAGRKLAVFSWYGADVAIGGNWARGEYVSDESSVPLIANLHQRLEARREEARTSGGYGPRVLVAGPTDSGKSSMVRTLAAYAARVGRVPTVVDLDIGQGELSVPGTLAAATIDRTCLSVEEPYGSSATAPLVFFYGYVTLASTTATTTTAATTGTAMVGAGAGAGGGASAGGSGSAAVSASVALGAGGVTDTGNEPFRNYLHRLADTLQRRQQHDAVGRVSGYIVNTMGLIEGAGYEMLVEALQSMQIDVVVVMGHDRLHNQLTEDAKSLRYPSRPAPLPPPPASAGAGAGAATAATTASSSVLASDASRSVLVVKVPRSGGVVERSRDLRRDARRWRCRDYFYGPDKGPGLPPSLSPASLTVGFDDVTIVRVGGATVREPRTLVMLVCAITADSFLHAGGCGHPTHRQDIDTGSLASHHPHTHACPHTLCPRRLLRYLREAGAAPQCRGLRSHVRDSTRNVSPASIGSRAPTPTPTCCHGPQHERGPGQADDGAAHTLLRAAAWALPRHWGSVVDPLNARIRTRRREMRVRASIVTATPRAPPCSDAGAPSIRPWRRRRHQHPQPAVAAQT